VFLFIDVCVCVCVCVCFFCAHFVYIFCCVFVLIFFASNNLKLFILFIIHVWNNVFFVTKFHNLMICFGFVSFFIASFRIFLGTLDMCDKSK